MLLSFECNLNYHSNVNYPFLKQFSNPGRTAVLIVVFGFNSESQSIDDFNIFPNHILLKPLGVQHFGDPN